MRIEFLIFFISSFGLADALELKELDFSPNLKVEAFTSVNNGKFKTPSGSILILTREKFSEQDAKKLLKNKLAQLKMLFEPRSAPYPGMVTTDQTCRKTARFPAKIEESSNSLFWYAELPASEDFTFASCGSRKDIYQSQYLVIYCKSSQQLYDVRYFVPLGQNEFILGQSLAKCKK